MNLKTKSILLITICFLVTFAVSYGLLQLFSHDINTGVAHIFVSLLLLSFVLAMFLNRFVLKRVYRLDKLMQSFIQGDEVVFPAVTSADEIGHLENSFQQMMTTLRGYTKDLESNVGEQTQALIEKNIQLNSAYQSLQYAEARHAAIGEITRNYLTRGNLEESLELLVSNAAKFSGALGGRFLHCVAEAGEIRITAVSKTCWADPDSAVLDSQTQAAFETYAQLLRDTEGKLLVGTLEKNKTLIFSAEQYVAGRSIPLPAGHPEIESLMLTPVSHSGKILGVIALANCPGGFGGEEVSSVETFAAEAALLVYAESQEVARAAAEETARLRSAFLANMSHELRTPLSVIIGMNRLLQGMKNSRVQQDYLEKIDFSAEQLLELINNVLDLAKISSGQKFVLEEAPFEPEALFYNIAQTLAFRQDNHTVELHVDINGEIPPWLIGDSLHLTSILNNLISNALKFTPQGTVTLQVVPRQPTADRVILDFSVIDTGIGLSDNQLAQIFQPFVQVDSSSTRQQGGSGLGLTLSRELCRLLGGDLSVESGLGQGSTFYFSLPFKIDHAAASTIPLLQLDVDLPGVPLLLASSCPVCCEILPRILEAMRCRVDVTAAASDALMLLKSAREQGHPYQLALLGVLLDDMPGVKFAEQLRTHEFPELHTILMANPADIAQLSEQAAALAIAELVPMPVRPTDLFSSIATALGASVDLPDSATQLSVHWQQVKVLLVDDNEMGRQMGRALLENVGIEVVEAGNGIEAVEQVAAGDFDLVLMDIQMPVLDGLGAARAIRKLNQEHIANLPILAMTAHAFDEHKADSLAAGMNGHLTKPISIETLYTELQRWLPREKQQLVNETVAAEHFSADNDLQAALPGVDVKAGIRRAVGDRHQYLNFLRKFVDHFSNTEPELRKELGLQQNKAAILRVHTLKGVAGNLGATQLQQLAGLLEEQLAEVKPPTSLEPMLEEHNRFLTALQRLPELHLSPPGGDKLLGYEAELKGILEQMLACLKSFKAQETKHLLEQIQKKVWPETYSGQLVRLEELVDRYQFNPAAELVQILLND